MRAVLPVLCCQTLLLLGGRVGWAGETPVTVSPATHPDAPLPAGPAQAPANDGPLFASPTRLDRIGRIVAPVTINGKGPFRMVIDTGASDSSISPQLATALGLAPRDDFKLVVNGVTGSAQLPSTVVDRIQAGSVIVENARVPVIWSSIMANADGILGVAGLHRERVMVDFEHDIVSISRSGAGGTPLGYSKVRARRLPGGLLAVDAMVGNIKTQAIIDTGSERTLGNPALLEQLLAHRKHGRGVEANAVVTDVYGATEDVSNGELHTAPAIQLGSVNISDVTLICGDFHIFDVWNLRRKPALIVGMDVLGSVRAIAIDFAEAQLYIDASLRSPGTMLARY